MSKCIDPKLGVLLHGYELKLLSEDETKRFELHLMKCEHCLDRLRSFERNMEMLTSAGEVTKLIDEATEMKRPDRVSVLRKLWRYVWPDTPLILKPALPYLLILLLIIPAYYGMVMLSKKGNVKTENILLAGGTRSSTPAEALTIEVESQTQYILEVPLEKQIRGDTLGLTIEETDGTLVWQQEMIIAPEADRRVCFTLPQSKLRTGIYRLVIYDYRTDKDQPRYLRIVKK